MIGLLQSLLDHLVCWIETGAVDFANYLIVGVAAVVQVLLVLFPAMPAFPTLPGDLSWFYWLVPVSSIAGALTTGATLYATIVVLQIAARWVRLL